MSAPIGPGEPLICVDGSNPHPRNPAYRLTEGAVYIVKRTYVCGPEKYNGGVCLECGKNFYVVIHERPHWGYCSHRFRPLSDGAEAELIEQLKKPALADAERSEVTATGREAVPG